MKFPSGAMPTMGGATVITIVAAIGLALYLAASVSLSGAFGASPAPSADSDCPGMPVYACVPPVASVKPQIAALTQQTACDPGLPVYECPAAWK